MAGKIEKRSRGILSKAIRGVAGKLEKRPAEAPKTLIDSVITLTHAISFGYAETLGKWHLLDLPRAILYSIMDKRKTTVTIECGERSDCVQLTDPEILNELYELKRCLTLTMLFSKKRFRTFLFAAQFTKDDILLRKRRARILKPAFTVIRDKKSKCLFVFIRGTRSIKDTLTDAIGAPVYFNHYICSEGELKRNNKVAGHGHRGMVAAARWIKKHCTPILLDALRQYPDFEIKIVGHSLGGGTAALLTYILREQKEFSASNCVTFAPAACMTWELAESGKHFITTIINGSDLVPTFSTSSIDDLRSEITASSWLNDLRDQVEHTKVLNVVYRSATALGSRLPSISSAKARVAGAGAILWPVTSGTQVVMKRAQSVAEAVVKTRSSLSSWSCMSARRRNVGTFVNSKTEDLTVTSLISERSTESHMTEEIVREPMLKDESTSSSGGSGRDDTDEEELLIPANEDITASAVDDFTEGQLWYELEKELQKQDNTMNIEAQEEAAAAKEITEEENQLVDAAAECSCSSITSDNLDSHRFYPPGRIMHIVSVPLSDDSNSNPDDPLEEHVGLYETPRELYSKLRLSRTMINDHYMPMYKKMMELLIRELEKDSSCNILD